MHRWLLVLFLALTQCLSGIQNLPEVEAALPQPTSLTANWWSFYDVSSEELIKRKQETEALFTQLESNLSKNNETKIKLLIKEFLTGLQLLIEEKQRKPLPDTFSYSYQESYTYLQWIGLIEQLAALKVELREGKLRSESQYLSMKSEVKRQDSLFASYLSQDPNAPSRLVDGLEVMTSKVAIEIQRNVLNALQQTLQREQKKVNFFAQEVEAAQGLVDFSQAPHGELENGLVTLQKEQAKRQQQQLLLYEEKLKLNRESPLYAIANGLIASKQMRLEMLEATLLLKETNLRMQLFIIGWEGKQLEITHEIIKQRLENWSQLIRQIQANIQYWEVNADLLFDEALKSLAGTGANENGEKAILAANWIKEIESASLSLEQLRGQLVFTHLLYDQVEKMKENLPTTFQNVWFVFVNKIKSFFNKHGTWFQESLFKIGTVPVTPWGLIKLLFILICAHFIARFFRKIIPKMGHKRLHIDRHSLFIISRFVYYLILIMGILIAGASIGFDLTAFAFIAGAFAIWVGFGLQGLFYNFICGIIVILSRAVRLNDLIELESGQRGMVTEMNLRTTTLTCSNGDDIIIPNSELVSRKFINLTFSGYFQQIEIPFKVSRAVNKEALKIVVLEAAQKVALSLEEPKPEMWIRALKDGNFDCTLAVWIDMRTLESMSPAVESQYFWALDEAFKAHNIAPI